MPTRILGLSGFFHDSAAVLIVDGQVTAAAQEERFTRVKHDSGFPTHAVEWCLAHAGVQPSEIDFIVWYEKPLRHFERLLETAAAFAPWGLRSFTASMPPWLEHKLWMPSVIRREIPGAGNAALLFIEHHQSHAASAFFPSPFEEAAVLTVDGVGEWATASWGMASGNQITLREELRFPHSLGLLYSAFTGHLGFRVNGGEYKLMGLAPYGRPVFADLIRSKLIDSRPDGSFRLRQQYFNYCKGLTMTSPAFARLFGIPPRTPESRLEQRHMDLAASIQLVTEDLLLEIARDVHRKSGAENLAMAGGVALNCVANERLLREGPFRRIWVQPAAGDAGGALGAAQFVWYQLLQNQRTPPIPDGCAGSLTGPAWSNAEVSALLRARGIPYSEFGADEELAERVASLLAEGKTVGWFQNRMEFGPRALGCRSILADARSPSLQTVLNLQVKFRESFRPFAPVVLREHAAEWFDVPPNADLPYMLFTAPVRPEKRISLSEDQIRKMTGSPDLLERVRIPRSQIPAVTHVDYSARLQTVDPQRHPRLQRLLTAFYQITGCPVLVNTSFNVRGEPIVCSPDDALNCFLTTGLNALVMENCLIETKQFPLTARPALRAVGGPDTRTLRQFAFLWLLLFAAGAGQCWRQGHSAAGLVVAIAAAAGLPGLIWPELMRPLFSGLLLITSPIRWIVSRLILATIYFGVVFPLSLYLRVRGHDPLQLHGESVRTFWVARPPQPPNPFRPW